VKRLTAGNLVRAIVEGQASSVRERARGIGQRIRSEAGVAEAVRRIESYAAVFKANEDLAL